MFTCHTVHAPLNIGHIVLVAQTVQNQNKTSVTFQSTMEQQLNKEMAQWAADLACKVSKQLFINFSCTNT